MSRSKSEAPWATVLDRIKKSLRGSGSGISQRRRGASEFVQWADGLSVPLTSNPIEVVADFIKTLDVHRRSDGSFTKQGEACAVMAKELLDEAARMLTEADDEASDVDDAVAQVAATMKDTAQDDNDDSELSPPEEEQMAPKHVQEEQDEELNEGDEGDEGEEGDEEGDEGDEQPEEEEQPKQRKLRAPPVQRVQFVQQVRAPRGPPVARAEARSSAVKSLLPRPEKIRLYKRNEMGKRELIEDFTVDEIGDMKLEAFIREYIDPQYSNEGSDTEYIAYELDPRTGKEKQPPSSITIRGQAAAPEAPDPFSQARKAFGMMQEMQQAMSGGQPATPPKNTMLEAAQQQAAAKGDTSQMFMLMMMERMMATQQAPPQQANGDLLLKVLDRMERLERRGQPGRGGGDSDFGPPVGGFQPSPFMPPPFFAPPPPREDHTNNKLLDLALSKLAAPPPSLADSMKELMAMQTLMSPRPNENAEVAALRAEIRALSAGGSSTKPGSLEDSLATFEKLATISKAVNTQISGGSDVGGFFKGLITPEVGKAIASIVGAGQNQMQQAAAAQQAATQQPAQQPVQQAAPAPTHVAPRDPNQPPKPIPAGVVEAVKLFHVAQTPEVQSQRFVDIVLAMYTSGDPFYMKLLGPAFEELNKADQSVEHLKVPRSTTFMLIKEIRPQLARPDFVDACIAALASRAGTDLPATLTSTQGKWTLDYSGNVMMLEAIGARAVVEEPAPVQVQVEAPAVVQPEPVQLTTVFEPLPAAQQVVEVTPQFIEQVLPEPREMVGARPTAPV